MIRGKWGKMTLTDEERVWMEEHFAHTKNEEVARHLGVSLRTAVRLAREMGLEKNAEFVRAMQANAVHHAARTNRGQGNAGKANLLKYGKAYQFKPGIGNKDRLSAEAFSEMHRRSAETRKRTVMAERRRVAFGLEQKTDLRVIKAPKAKICLRNRLRKRGYVVPRASSDATIAADTRRSATLEQRAEKMGIRFYLTEGSEVTHGTQGR